jgi:hypothetical protein
VLKQARIVFFDKHGRLCYQSVRFRRAARSRERKGTNGE